MTTKPKAKKFRIRPEPMTRGVPMTSQAATAEDQTAMTGEVTSGTEMEIDNGIDAIRKEGLTGRQLRLARRVAQKHDVPATSDFDAVRQLRKRGIDPFQKSASLELVVADNDAPEEKPAQLPQTVPVKKTLPSTELADDSESPAIRRAREIGEIQKDIARRRQRKTAMLLVRLAFFVLLPTAICGWYFYKMATPQYATSSDFSIQSADSGGESGGLGSMISGGLGANTEAVAVQRYLQSREAMLRLDAEEGFKAHFQQPWIDPLLRLSADATNEEAYTLYKRKVLIGYDPTEGVMGLEVIAVDPETSKSFSEALIRYAEERVDTQTLRKREDQLSEARKSLTEAEQKRREAQMALVALQQEAAIVDPEGVISGLRGQITTRETELQEKEIQLQALLDNARPNQSRVDGVRGDIRRLEDAIADLQGRMNNATQGEDSLAAISSKIQLAQLDLTTRDMMLQAALQNLATSQLEASRQTRYMARGVEPVAPDEPSYPRSFENTLVSFLAFAGIYLMISLTASILREQVTS
ncbi:capsule biosynthesis protein [Donghicola tyrosinivorans]|uniref:Capsular polysaccharide transport system permease protein n=1 Tax=Donghicola tyrosinivorans TaxID=1652492 RepID=A0A2T0X0I2_9RHOB|nr:capsule biosynthesis protein [Donghicola tyrosinivorans]PRY92354.1 capsular polysaccharide transport system permease protein [Donghicola tyrosinivorans]